MAQLSNTDHLTFRVLQDRSVSSLTLLLSRIEDQNVLYLTTKKRSTLQGWSLDVPDNDLVAPPRVILFMSASYWHVAHGFLMLNSRSVGIAGDVRVEDLHCSRRNLHNDRSELYSHLGIVAVTDRPRTIRLPRSLCEGILCVTDPDFRDWANRQEVHVNLCGKVSWCGTLFLEPLRQKEGSSRVGDSLAQLMSAIPHDNVFRRPEYGKSGYHGSPIIQ